MTWDRIWDAWESGKIDAALKLFESGVKGEGLRQSSLFEFIKGVRPSASSSSRNQERISGAIRTPECRGVQAPGIFFCLFQGSPRPAFTAGIGRIAS